MDQTRSESDTMGSIEIPFDRLWGAQTQRSLANFKIGEERFPRELIRALGHCKFGVLRRVSFGFCKRSLEFYRPLYHRESKKTDRKHERP